MRSLAGPPGAAVTLTCKCGTQASGGEEINGSQASKAGRASQGEAATLLGEGRSRLLLARRGPHGGQPRERSAGDVKDCAHPHSPPRVGEGQGSFEPGFTVADPFRELKDRLVEFLTPSVLDHGAPASCGGAELCDRRPTELMEVMTAAVMPP